MSYTFDVSSEHHSKAIYILKHLVKFYLVLWAIVIYLSQKGRLNTFLAGLSKTLDNFADSKIKRDFILMNTRQKNSCG